ncbi:MAG: VTT domain-containing protein [gamma proteobacterium symbiont of Bathyaustriella thionipta]|nr:VTT domain-containing protein [gamma proteobacterium symbiont of Bathyaustriella thionipta]MCU7951407.1 VTT domain-containing protein [gamma proteobacterium symbiont of Bathyaustriella thionipta]MCU7952507.1 VTT domain-containing protein [gamma proteobacterium symbiont of Bathyaustriella thionipta]MCU7957961.1 VTT domain-containing protein [gamma proteobacterium symbiont of Bathyaustriella thionipta]MCU7968687.1 VTT domain-containing protein [gamma proteobacterium symbiont of Bathyaustriella
MEKIIQIIESNGEYAIGIFWLINFLAVLLFIPLTLFWIIAGMLFGSLTGTILTASASVSAAAVAFLLCRRFEKQFEQLINRSEKALKWKEKLETKIENNSFTILFIIRVLPHPFILLSYIAGFSKAIRINTFILATLLAITPISFSFVLLGDGLLNNTKAFILPIVLILLVTQLPRLIKRLTKTDY